MAEEGFKRKLAAILCADVEGYSRLMGEDEDATIRTLTTYRKLMSTIILKHRGRVVDSPGDGLWNLSQKVPEASGQDQHPVRKGEIEGELVIGRVK